jgi:hypothetical protein
MGGPQPAHADIRSARRPTADAEQSAVESRIEITVDGAPRAFTLVTVDEDWAGAGERVLISGSGPVPTELVAYSGNAS